MANNLHSQQLIDEFVPILNFHPRRKDKRMKGGLRLVGSKEESPEKHAVTPAFRSFIDPVN